MAWYPGWAAERLPRATQRGSRFQWTLIQSGYRITSGKHGEIYLSEYSVFIKGGMYSIL